MQMNCFASRTNHIFCQCLTKRWESAMRFHHLRRQRSPIPGCRWTRSRMPCNALLPCGPCRLRLHMTIMTIYSNLEVQCEHAYLDSGRGQSEIQ